MGKSIKLVLIYLLMQVVAAMISIVISIPFYGIDLEASQTFTLVTALLLGMVGMMIYLYRSGEIPTCKNTWSPVSFLYMVLSLVAGLCGMVLVDFVTSGLSWLPNWMENTFDQVLSTGLGVLGVALFGPVLEELLFRGAVTRILLQRYSPAKAILFSALIFGIFHINPAQIAGATLIGLFLAWIYYRTESLVPCILIHVLNNSLAVGADRRFPEVETLADLMQPSAYYVLISASIVIFALCLFAMNRQTTPNKVIH
ncbi:MAG: CPBP family intramembrane metalloprotease [Bacteroides sp.]|nr:CPBP family intramembrane metalloprotease [Bacteroides sp.]